MKKVTRIEAYNKKFVQELALAQKLIEPYLIRAFSLVYGEYYQEHIKAVIENIRFQYYIPHSLLKMASENTKGLSKRDKKVIQGYLRYLEQLKLKYKNLNVDQLEEKILSQLIVKTSFDLDLLVFNHALDLLKLDASNYTIFSDEEEQNFYQTIFLPIYVVDLKMIIHEINYALMIDVVAVTPDCLVMPNLFLTSQCEEIFNDYLTYHVLEQYVDMQFPLPQVFKRFNIFSQYESGFYLVENFYSIFEDVIKRSIMTKNFNLLWNYAGKQNFYLYCQLVHHYSLNGCTQEEFDQLNQLVLNMYHHALMITDESFRQEQAQIRKLEK